MANTPVLNMEVSNFAGGLIGYAERLEVDRIENTSCTIIDQQTGNVSASFYTKFYMTGTLSTFLSNDVGASYCRCNRVLKEVVAFAEKSGSGGVTRINVLRQEDGVGGAFVSIFSSNALKPALSAALGNYGIAKSVSISGSLWKAGTVLRVALDTAADVQANLTVCLVWAPSGSYGSAV